MILEEEGWIVKGTGSTKSISGDLGKRSIKSLPHSVSSVPVGSYLATDYNTIAATQPKASSGML